MANEKNWCVWCAQRLQDGWPQTRPDYLGNTYDDFGAFLECPRCGGRTNFDSFQFGRHNPPYAESSTAWRCPNCEQAHFLDLAGSVWGDNPPLPCPRCGIDLRDRSYYYKDPGWKPNSKKSTPGPGIGPAVVSHTRQQSTIPQGVPQKQPSSSFPRTQPDTSYPVGGQQQASEGSTPPVYPPPASHPQGQQGPGAFPRTQPDTSYPVSGGQQQQSQGSTSPVYPTPISYPQGQQGSTAGSGVPFDPDVILGTWRGISDGRQGMDDDSITTFVKRQGEYRYVGILTRVGTTLQQAKFSQGEEMNWFNPTDQPGVYKGYQKRRSFGSGEQHVYDSSATMVTQDKIDMRDAGGNYFFLRVMASAQQAVPPSRVMPVQPPATQYVSEQPVDYAQPGKGLRTVLALVLSLILLGISIAAGLVISDMLPTTLIGMDSPFILRLLVFFGPAFTLTLITLGFLIPPIWSGISRRYGTRGCATWLVNIIKVLAIILLLVFIVLLVLYFTGTRMKETWVSSTPGQPNGTSLPEFIPTLETAKPPDTWEPPGDQATDLKIQGVFYSNTLIQKEGVCDINNDVVYDLDAEIIANGLGWVDYYWSQAYTDQWGGIDYEKISYGSVKFTDANSQGADGVGRTNKSLDTKVFLCIDQSQTCYGPGIDVKITCLFPEFQVTSLTVPQNTGFLATCPTSVDLVMDIITSSAGSISYRWEVQYKDQSIWKSPQMKFTFDKADSKRITTTAPIDLISSGQNHNLTAILVLSADTIYIRQYEIELDCMN